MVSATDSGSNDHGLVTAGLKALGNFSSSDCLAILLD